MEKILIVDEKRSFSKGKIKKLESIFDQLSVITIPNFKKAMAQFASHSINLIISNFKKNSTNGIKLLKKIDKNHPHIPKIIINPKDCFKNQLMVDFKGVTDYIEEPFGLSILAEKIYTLLILNQKKFHQKVLTLPSFMKLIEMDKKTCTLTVKYRNKTGFLYFIQGNLIETTVDNINGVEAVNEILDWDESVITIFDKCDAKKRQIHSPVDSIIFNALKNKTKNKIKMEENMNKEVFEQAQKIILDRLGDAVLAASFWVTGDGQPLVSYEKVKAVNIAAANALFDRVTKMINDSLTDSEFPVQLNRYYLMDLTGNMIALVVQLEQFQWGMLIDTKLTSLGMILNVALPKAMELFKKK